MTDADPSTDRAMAKADAAAAKARAKALRPWYRKKRWWVAGAIVAIIGISAVSSGGDDDTVSTTAGGIDSTSTNSKNPPAADVTLTKCERNSSIPSILDVELEIVNHSSKRSNYSIAFSVTDPGGVKVGEGFAASNNVEPGQKALEDAVGSVTGNPASITCKLTTVQRYASS